jgi:hypothetical protein
VHAFPSLQAVPFETGVCVHAPAEHASAVHGLPSSHEPEHVDPPPSDPKPSWHVTVAPEFMRTCAAARAPVNFDVFTVTSAWVATNSASICAPEFRLIPDDVSKYITSALAVSPDPVAGPAYDPLLKLAAPVTETVVAALTESVAPLFSVRDEKTYVPPVSESLAPELTVTAPYAPAASVREAPEFNVTAVVPAVAGGSVGGAGIAGNVETTPCVAPLFPITWSVSRGPSDAPLFRYVL